MFHSSRVWLADAYPSWSYAIVDVLESAEPSSSSSCAPFSRLHSLLLDPETSCSAGRIFPPVINSHASNDSTPTPLLAMALSHKVVKYFSLWVNRWGVSSLAAVRLFSLFTSPPAFCCIRQLFTYACSKVMLHVDSTTHSFLTAIAGVHHYVRYIRSDLSSLVSAAQ